VAGVRRGKTEGLLAPDMQKKIKEKFPEIKKLTE
jgi:hypothetical protein